MVDFQNATFTEIQADPRLYTFALAGGEAAFKDNCATCHGTGGAGAPGYPNLNDDAWLWGGTVDEIYHTVQFGVRNDNVNSHSSEMPAFGGISSAGEISTVADYILGMAAAPDAAGSQIFADNCAACHGENGEGLTFMGAPNLADAIWHFGGEKADIVRQISAPRHGQMPAWAERLDPETIRQLTLYVHSLGGGEE